MVHHSSPLKGLPLWRSRKADRYYKSIVDEGDEIVVPEKLHDHRTCLRLPSSEQTHSSVCEETCQPSSSVSSLGGESESILFFLSGEDDGAVNVKGQRPSFKKHSSVSTASESHSTVSETTELETEKQDDDNDTLKTDDVSVVERISTVSTFCGDGFGGLSRNRRENSPRISNPQLQSKEMETESFPEPIHWSEEFQNVLLAIHSLPKQMEPLQDEFEILRRLYYLVEI
jgi:hypothetical protein